MYRDNVEKYRKLKGITNKRLAEESGVSVDTIDRIIHPENPLKDSPRVNTLEDICKVLGIELWELFYAGDKFEINILKSERDDLLKENSELKEQVQLYKEKIDLLKNEVILAQHYYMMAKEGIK